MAKSKLSIGQENFLKAFFKIQNPQNCFAEEKNRNAQNRFGSGSCMTTATVIRLLEFIFSVEKSFNNAARLKYINPLLTVGNQVQKFDMARYTVLALDSEAYMTILD